MMPRFYLLLLSLALLVLLSMRGNVAFVPLVVTTPSRYRQTKVTTTTTTIGKPDGGSSLSWYMGTVLERETASKQEETSFLGDDDDAEPLIEIPMESIKLPMMAVGKECVTVPIKIHDDGPYKFMIDTGLTVEMISPSLLKEIKHHLMKANKQKKARVDEPTGIAAGGSTGSIRLLDLDGIKISNGNEKDDISLPNDTVLPTIVSHFAQENLDKAHAPVKGMVGMEFLTLFDIDFDFPKRTIRFWKPGTAAKEAKRCGMVEIPIAVINESLVLGTRMTASAGTPKPKETKEEQEQKQPFLGIIDSGSTFSAINWEAAKLIGLPQKNSLTYLKPPGIMAVGLDNKPLYIPTKKIQFSYCGYPMMSSQSKAKGEEAGNDKQKNDRIVVGFEAPPKEWKPWNPVLTGIGDLPLFELVLGTKDKPFDGPAALIGMDILSQRRVILESCDGKERRQGRMFVSPE